MSPADDFAGVYACEVEGWCVDCRLVGRKGYVDGFGFGRTVNRVGLCCGWCGYGCSFYANKDSGGGALRSRTKVSTPSYDL